MAGHFDGSPQPSNGHVLPFGQLRHAANPPVEYEPARHADILAPSHARPWKHGGGSIVLVLEHNVPGGHAVQLSSSPPSQVHSTREPFPTRLSRHVWNTMSPSSMSQLIRNVTTAWASIVALPVHSLNATSAKEHVAVDCSNKVYVVFAVPKSHSAPTTSLNPNLVWNVVGLK